MRLRLLLAAVVALSAPALAPGAAAAQTVAPAVATPCADSLYLSLRGKALDALSEREYEYFMQRERACVEHQRLMGMVNQPRPTAAAAQRPAPLATEAFTRPSTRDGVDVFVRNLSDRPIIVNSVEVYECRNLAATVCGTHQPKMRILPRQARRVLTIRYGSPDDASSYRYRYHVTSESPES